MHKRDELRADAFKSDWTPPAFERVDAYCSRFPESCDSSNRLNVNQETRFLVDSFGRTTLLHGVNAIYKVDPFIPSEMEFDP
jgi:endoglycosylceramidase